MTKTRAQVLVESLEPLFINESAPKVYLDTDGTSSKYLINCTKDLERSGLKLGTDFFLKSDGSSWILNTKLDSEQDEILAKYNIEEIEDEDENGNDRTSAYRGL